MRRVRYQYMAPELRWICKTTSFYSFRNLGGLCTSSFFYVPFTSTYWTWQQQVSTTHGMKGALVFHHLFGCDSSPRSPNVSMSVCYTCYNCTKVLLWTSGLLKDFGIKTSNFIVYKIYKSQLPGLRDLFLYWLTHIEWLIGGLLSVFVI